MPHTITALIGALVCLFASCSDTTSQHTQLFLNSVPTEDGVRFRSGVTIYPQPDTEMNLQLLTDRDRFATTLTDPYGYIWSISTAQGLDDLDFAESGRYQTSITPTGLTFYYGKIPTWEILAECVVYLSAHNHNFVVLRRYQDQAACPTALGYADWLPETTSPASSTITAALWAYGANNSPDNIVHGTFGGVTAYGNDPAGQTCGDFQNLSDCLAYSGISLTGVKWDSAEFVSRYFITKYNHNPMWQGPAKFWYQEARNYGLGRSPNCGSVRPKVGDMLVSEGGPAGHAAIVREVSDHSVTVIQQNWFDSIRDNNYTLHLRTAGNHFCVSAFGDSYPVVGWVWAHQ